MKPFRHFAAMIAMLAITVCALASNWNAVNCQTYNATSLDSVLTTYYGDSETVEVTVSPASDFCDRVPVGSPRMIAKSYFCDNSLACGYVNCQSWTSRQLVESAREWAAIPDPYGGSSVLNCWTNKPRVLTATAYCCSCSNSLVCKDGTSTSVNIGP